jgi:prepilin-type N-terminal cleavage/methylation domain-containing protein
MKKIKKNNSGFSLLEVLISILIMSLIVIIVVEVFIKVREIQNRTFLAQNLQEGLWSAFNSINYELKNAEKNSDDSCGTCSGKYFCYDEGSGYFYYLDDTVCSIYKMGNDSEGVSRLILTKNSIDYYLTPDNIKINALDFVMNNSSTAITINLQAETIGLDRYKKSINLQTSVVVE